MQAIKREVDNTKSLGFVGLGGELSTFSAMSACSGVAGIFGEDLLFEASRAVGL
jgi:hypothetical protein